MRILATQIYSAQAQLDECQKDLQDSGLEALDADVEIWIESVDGLPGNFGGRSIV
jgi:hypothetical protein